MKKDFLFSIITGLTTGIISWAVLSYLGLHTIVGVPVWWLIVIIPVLWMLGVQLGYFLGRWFDFFKEFGKFCAIGFTNFAVDFGVLNTLIYLTSITSGYHYPLFKIISFTLGTTHGYFWNKYWTFQRGHSGGGVAEFGKFFGVATIAGFINISIASLVVNVLNPGSIDPKIWANVGSIVGSAVALVFSFVGFRLAVFKVRSMEQV